MPLERGSGTSSDELSNRQACHKTAKSIVHLTQSSGEREKKKRGWGRKKKNAAPFPILEIFVIVGSRMRLGYITNKALA